MRSARQIITAVVVLAFSGAFAGGCAPTAGTVLAAAAQKAWEDRSTGDQVTDAKITTGILKRLANKDKDLLLDVSVDVWEQRVMLTGTLDDAKTRDGVVKLARADDRIKAFHNEIQVVSTAQRDQRRQQAEQKDSGEKGGVGQTVNDVWIETKIKAKLLTASGVTSVNYFWRSVRNTIYVIGRARSTGERDKVLAIIRGTDGVKGVKHFIQIKPAG